MRTRVQHALLALASLVACNRYEWRPATSADCAPIPPARVNFERSAVLDRRQRITGTIVDGDAEEPTAAPQTLIRLLSGADTVRRTSSDARGAFLMDSVPAGTYVLRSLRVGYHLRLDVVEVARDSSLAVTVPLRRLIQSLCPGGMKVGVKKPWWKFW